ncbi:MAG: hypothetical protein GY759_07710 [Chloroflexi bacterium]|nr:hypothetical protein [Chloroflexota bacterium]
MAETELIPMWLLLAAALSFLIPWGVALVAAGGLTATQARQMMLTPLAAYALAILGYAFTGFAIHYGGIGLKIDHPDLAALIWEWSALSEEWGVTWGMAGLAGFWLQGASTRLGYLLLISTLPWATTATLLPMMVLRGRAPAAAVALVGALTAAVAYPLIGNWVQGGGWLANLGFNLGLGHGYVDFGGATLFLMGGGVALAGILAFLVRRPGHGGRVVLPPVHLPLLAVLGAGLIIAGSTGWLVSWPLIDWSQVDAVIIVGNALLAAAAGAAIPLLYTWFFAGHPDPLMAARGVAAGWVAVLAGVPFYPAGAALLIGASAGLLMVLTMYFIDHVARLEDVGGVLAMLGVPALWGILAVGLFASGTAGAGYNAIGADQYMGIVGQGVAGLRVAQGYIADWPGQMQAQLAGVAVIFLLSFLLTSLLAVPMALIARAWSGKNETISDDDSSESAEHTTIDGGGIAMMPDDSAQTSLDSEAGEEESP